MSYLKINQHISAQFNAELESAMSKSLSMGGLVEQQLNDVFQAIASQDRKLAEEVVKRDSIINRTEVEISEACIKVIAKRQPTASDLRLLIVIIKVISEIERIGDAVKHISDMVTSPLPEQYQPVIMSLDSLSKRVITLFHDVLDAFARMDLDAAVRLYPEDNKIDQEYEAIIRQLMTYMMEDPRAVPNILTAMSCARSLERIGDRCQNICEFIVYFVKGEDVRHNSEEAMSQLLEHKDKNKS